MPFIIAVGGKAQSRSFRMIFFSSTLRHHYFVIKVSAYPYRNLNRLHPALRNESKTRFRARFHECASDRTPALVPPWAKDFCTDNIASFQSLIHVLAVQFKIVYLGKVLGEIERQELTGKYRFRIYCVYISFFRYCESFLRQRVHSTRSSTRRHILSVWPGYNTDTTTR